MNTAMGDKIAKYNATDPPTWQQITHADARGMHIEEWKIAAEHLIVKTEKGNEYTIALEEDGEWAGKS